MMKLIFPKKPYSEAYDLLHVDRALVTQYKPEMLQGRALAVLQYASKNTWVALEKILGAEQVQSLRDNSIYKCPWTENQFFGLFPLAIITDDLAKVFGNFIEDDHKPWWYDMAVDKDWS